MRMLIFESNFAETFLKLSMLSKQPTLLTFLASFIAKNLKFTQF